MSTPFLLFPWNKPFLPALKQEIARRVDAHWGRVVLIIPHNRPRRYFLELFKADAGQAMLLPRVLTLSELVAEYRAAGKRQPRQAELLDRVALLYRCLASVAAQDDALRHKLGAMDMEHFLPWGIRLSGIMEECFAHCISAQDLHYTEHDVPPFAAALLGSLAALQQSYTQLLLNEGWSTPSFDVFSAAEAASSIPPLFRPQANRAVFIAGFAMLTEGENRLFKALWEAGAHICLHTDARLATGAGIHWSTQDHRTWLHEWHASAEVIESEAQPSPHQPAPQQYSLMAEHKTAQPHIHFCAGHDVHSQLFALQRDLHKAHEEDSRTGSSPSTAIVLTGNELLMPVLHHLPEKAVNISMGYPLSRSPLFSLLESLLALAQESRTPAAGQGRRFHWRALLQCLRHPYITMLHVSTAEGHSLALRESIRIAEKSIRAGQRFVSLSEIMQECRATAPAEAMALLEELCTLCFESLPAATTTAHIAACFEQLASLLLRHGGDIWERFPLDAECLYRLVQRLLPQLRQNSLANTPFSFSLLHALTRELVQAERVPFDVEPITGMQVLGMLETRLLHFDRLFILDATDDALPGAATQDPLLPDALRGLLGLPATQHRERIAAHTLYRLTSSADDVYFYWQEGIQRSSLFNGKKIRSRFVEQYLWQEEQKRGHLLTPGQAPLRQAGCRVHALVPAAHALPASPALHAAMQRLLAKPLSPTTLDSYLTCPLRFAYRHLCKAKVLQEVNEGDDPAAVGTVVHNSLKQLFEPYLGKDVHAGDISQHAVEDCIAAAMQQQDIRATLPVESYIMLRTAAPLRLHSFLQHQPALTHILALEQAYTAPLTVQGHSFTLYGVLDRMDIRNGQAHILDYKTGAIKATHSAVWSDPLLQQRIAALSHDEKEPDAEDLQMLSALMPSVQLPCYILLGQANAPVPVGNAALVNLKENGAEVPLFDADMDAEAITQATQYNIPDLLSFILLHMQKAQYYPSIEGAHCRYCEYHSLCHK
jgi:ATP-dependent helicase/nuclease subunit B